MTMGQVAVCLPSCQLTCHRDQRQTAIWPSDAPYPIISKPPPPALVGYCLTHCLTVSFPSSSVRCCLLEISFTCRAREVSVISWPKTDFQPTPPQGQSVSLSLIELYLAELDPPAGDKSDHSFFVKMQTILFSLEKAPWCHPSLSALMAVLLLSISPWYHTEVIQSRSQYCTYCCKHSLYGHGWGNLGRIHFLLTR